MTVSPPRSGLAIDEDDVALIFEDLHRGRTVIPPHAVPTKPVLVRWDLTKELSVENCVVMERQECERHLNECIGGGKEPGAVWGEDAAAVVRRRQEEIRRVMNQIL
jgi:hypothetical protein